MADVKALIEAVRAILESAQGLVDVSIKRPGYHSRQFQRFIEPAFKVLETIHEDYGDRFRDTRNLLIESPGTDPALEIGFAAESLLVARKDLEKTRELFRSNVNVMLDAVQITSFKVFVVAVADYVVLNEWDEASEFERSPERYLDDIERRSSITVLRTPSSKLIDYLLAAGSVDEALLKVDRIIETQNKKFEHAMIAYESAREERYIF